MENGFIIILLLSLFVAAALIFFLLKVLKNTFDITFKLMETTDDGFPIILKTAYNDKYYPAAAIIKVEFDAKEEGKIVDFSLYEKYKVVGFTIFTKDSIEKFYGEDAIEEFGGIEEIKKPIIIKNVLVYEFKEGDWLWKLAE